MAKRPKKEENPLYAALKFVSIAQEKHHDNPAVCHCRVINNSILAHNGVVGVGINAPDMDLPDCLPHTHNLMHALDKATGNYTVTFENNSVTVKTSKFKAVVPCVQSNDIPFQGPDQANYYESSNAFRDALAQAAIFTREGASTMLESAVCLTNGSVIGTDKMNMIEVWHGHYTQPGMIIPKTFIDTLVKIKKDIMGISWSETSMTVWFTDQSFAKTQLYVEDWPNCEPILNETNTGEWIETPKSFWQAIETCLPFSETSAIYISEGKVRSSKHANVGAEYTVKELQAKVAINGKQLNKLNGKIEYIDLYSRDNMIMFRGGNIRGVSTVMRPDHDD